MESTDDNIEDSTNHFEIPGLTDRSDSPEPPVLIPIRKPRGRPRGGRGPGRPPITQRLTGDDSKPPSLRVIIRGRGRGQSRGRGRSMRGRGRGPGRPRGSSSRGMERGKRPYAPKRLGRPPLSMKYGRGARGAVASLRGMHNKRINILTGLPEKMQLKDRVNKLKELRLNKIKKRNNTNVNKDGKNSAAGSVGVHSKKSDKTAILRHDDDKEYWSPPSNIKSIMDQVMITDVTTDQCTITIRESSSYDGFFRNREQGTVEASGT